MTWKDVLTSDDPMQYLKFEPHFHLFFSAPQGHFEYSVVPSVYKDSGWVFHRIEKGGEDNHVPVEDLEDLVHQITYRFFHCGVNDWYADRDELTSRMKGELATDFEYVPESTKNKVLAHFCEAAPKLLGTRFVNLNEATCDAEVSSERLIHTPTAIVKTTIAVGLNTRCTMFGIQVAGSRRAAAVAELALSQASVRYTCSL